MSISSAHRDLTKIPSNMPILHMLIHTRYIVDSCRVIQLHKQTKWYARSRGRGKGELKQPCVTFSQQRAQNTTDSLCCYDSSIILQMVCFKVETIQAGRFGRTKKCLKIVFYSIGNFSVFCTNKTLLGSSVLVVLRVPCQWRHDSTNSMSNNL